MIYVPESPRQEPAGDPDQVCPACGGAVQDEKCKVVGDSDACTCGVIKNCTGI